MNAARKTDDKCDSTWPGTLRPYEGPKALYPWVSDSRAQGEASMSFYGSFRMASIAAVSCQNPDAAVRQCSTAGIVSPSLVTRPHNFLRFPFAVIYLQLG